MNEMKRMLEEVIRRRGSVELPSVGFSMYPLLRTGDVSRFRAVSQDRLRVGDVCLFMTRQGMLTGHRLHEVYENDGVTYYVFKGDTCYAVDEPVTLDCIVGQLDAIKRHSRWVRATHWRYRLLKRLSLRWPLWSRAMRRYVSNKSF